MQLAISNIAWDAKYDTAVYGLMREFGFNGLEIAPTRIFSDRPYERLNEAKSWAKDLIESYGFVVPSMQSIWYGKQEKIFGSKEERRILIEYTKKAINFAEAIGCNNLVFGCPRNRYLPEGADKSLAIPFFREIGDYAFSKGTCIGMEANPTIYSTNYINGTKAAFALIEQVNSKGFKLNLDVGTIIQNEENISEVVHKVYLINHVHISEPILKQIQQRKLHVELRDILSKENYRGFVSIEMGKVDDISATKDVMKYIEEIFR